jgi:hypothetical protein
MAEGDTGGFKAVLLANKQDGETSLSYLGRVRWVVLKLVSLEGGKVAAILQ